MLVAKAGEAVTDEAGNVICRVKNDIMVGSYLRPSDFHEFADGEAPWIAGQVYDKRCIRLGSVVGAKLRNACICINGEWRPANAE